jgi:transglutaminase-like putative cysteine protease
MLERNLRPARALLQRVLELDGSESLDHPRPAEQLVVGACRHFAVLATAFLRAVGAPARARCDFAAYFIPPKQVDHWIVEYWSEEDRRWIRVDPEYLDLPTPGTARPNDLRPGEFVDAGEAWQLVRSAQDDPASYGVFGTQNWGPGEIRGNAMRDLASLAAKVEMLPWDEWGPMADSYEGTTGDDFDELIDDLASATSNSDQREIRRIYERLAVPASMIQ